MPCGCSTAILDSTQEAFQAEQSWERRKESGNTRLFWRPRSTYRPPRTEVGQTRLRRSCSTQVRPAYHSRITAFLKQNLSLGSQRSPGNRALESQRHRQRRPYLLCYMDSHTNSHPGDTGTLNLNTISRTRSHKHTDHADKHCHNCRVTSTPHTHIPSATHHGNTVTTKSHAPYNITNTHTTETQSQIPQ